jgi:hypothetical protein
MDPQLLGKALGAIASYSLAREVFAVRFICCDAKAYDRGWVQPEQLFTILRCKGEAVPFCSRVLNYWIAWRCAEIFRVEGRY